MERKTNGERGMSLVEVTIILMVLAIVTAVAAPSINDYVQDARDVKVKEDVEAIGTSIARMVRDTGLPCLAVTAPSTTGCTITNKVELLYSDGTTPTVTAANFSTPNTTTTGGAAMNWKGTAQEPDPATRQDTMDNQLVFNAPNYDDPSDKATFVAGLRGGLGWRGGYLAGPVSADPWGKRYQANTVFIGVATNAAAGTSEGQLSAGWVRDVIVVSAGRNGVLETPFGGTTNGGSGTASVDDVFYVVSGSTR